MQKLILVVLYLASSVALEAATIVAVELAGSSSAVVIYDSKGGALAVSWSQPYTSTNTTIEAPLTYATVAPGAPLTAWLSRSIGSAMPASDIVASTGPIFAAPHDSPLPWTTFFSGLTLDPGTYYFIIAATDALFGWHAYNGTAVPGVVTQTAGALVLAEYSATPDFIASPVPNSGFVSWDVGFGDFHPLYRVSGDFDSDAQVPEPSAICLVLGGIGLMCGFRRLTGRRAGGRSRCEFVAFLEEELCQSSTISSKATDMDHPPVLRFPRRLTHENTILDQNFFGCRFACNPVRERNCLGTREWTRHRPLGASGEFPERTWGKAATGTVFVNNASVHEGLPPQVLPRFTWG